MDYLEYSRYIHSLAVEQSNYLAHHGIKGQKWGIRRFENEDGSLTPEGKARYYNSDGTLSKKGIKRANKAGYNSFINNRLKEIPDFVASEKRTEELLKKFADKPSHELHKEIVESYKASGKIVNDLYKQLNIYYDPVTSKFKVKHSDDLCNDVIAHHGIKGQEHGKRRFQYEDGSLTPAGKERYGVGNGRDKKSSQPNKKSDNKSKQTSQSKIDQQKEEEQKLEAERKAKMKKILVGAAVVAALAVTIHLAKSAGEGKALKEAENNRLQKNALAAERRQKNKEFDQNFAQNNPMGYALSKAAKKGGNVVVGNNSSASNINVKAFAAVMQEVAHRRIS